MQDELGISPSHWGWVVSVFAIAYAAFEIPSGALGDRIGDRSPDVADDAGALLDGLGGEQAEAGFGAADTERAAGHAPGFTCRFAIVQTRDVCKSGHAAAPGLTIPAR